LVAAVAVTVAVSSARIVRGKLTRTAAPPVPRCAVTVGILARPKALVVVGPFDGPGAFSFT
jgi:hypothetical protein